MDVYDEYDDEGNEELASANAEIENLRAVIKHQNVSLFQERKQWLAEKSSLQQQASADRDVSGARRHTVDHAPPPQPSDSGTMALRAQLTSLQGRLTAAMASEERAREEAALLRAQAAQWNVERAALQRQVEVLMQQKGGWSDGGADQSNSVTALEEEKWALQMELDLIKASFKNSCIIPRSQLSSLPGGGLVAMSRQSSSVIPSMISSDSALGSPPSRDFQPSTSSRALGGQNTPSAAAVIAAVQEAGTVQRLTTELTRLQAELLILREECVPVPKSEFAQLKAVHSAKAALETELRSVRAELGDVQRLGALLREEMELIREEHVPITMEEYDELRRASAEKEALQLRAAAQAKYSALVPLEELASLQAARRSAAVLEVQVAAMQATASLGVDEAGRALRWAHDEASRLRVQVLEAQQQVGDMRKETDTSEGRAKGAAALAERVKGLEASLAAGQQEKARLQLRVRGLEEQVTVFTMQLAGAREENARMAVDLGCERDAGSLLRQATSALARERGELESRTAELRADREALTHELVDAKLELARLREMEVLYRRQVQKHKVQLYGMPSDAKTVAVTN
mmetsp:Transcript_4529/g.7685  ORF Transcript_4529/g.7685 Transcript_4529/m.7685 type:complete len:578 (+) Transcript_4529:243-1976(+)|eukprot:CAMPEP_0119114656 /NCGR_PEP_ID=MMETSP1180-20130426/48173_1 /TAXON_ID=3052 ORGANISM="Chlamydomonas cf sp, Strain CCMP681" /NCGR_SAMPLE_ID=MMETSP1180 /ASSEMBLY_ACC=CAM_ASM_000741 /LENGTH=577 /DNA_ID=CAMNT_0007103299 /DNA_START=133 /DNA_END=1866 /DNA_ORIENTATION=-